MKKLIALALCLMLAVCSVAALAENTETGTVSASLGNNLYTWNVPAGFDASTVTSSDGSMYVYFMPEDEAKPLITFRLVMSDTEQELSDKAVSNLPQDQQDALVAALLEEMDFADPTVEFSTTASGMEVITLNENNDQCDYASMMFVYNDIMAECSIWHTDMSKLTDEDTATAFAIIESMVVTENAGTAVNEIDGLTVLYAAPEGYGISYEKYDDGTMIIYVNPTDETRAYYVVAVSKNESVPDGVRLNDLSDADKTDFLAYISQNYNDPTVTDAVTGEGTQLYILNENGCETDYADICTIYQGHNVCMSIIKMDGSEITEDEIQTGIAICTDAIISSDIK